MLNTQNKIWNATLYLRLSRDDGDKEEYTDNQKYVGTPRLHRSHGSRKKKAILLRRKTTDLCGRSQLDYCP